MPRFSSRNRVKRFTVSTITDPLHTFSYISPKQTKQFLLSTNNKNLSVYAENFYAFLHVAAAILFKSARYRFTRLVRKRVDLISIRRLQLRREIKGYPGSRPAAGLRYVLLLLHIASVDTSRFHSSRERERDVIANRRNHRSDPMEISCGARYRGGIIFSQEPAIVSPRFESRIPSFSRNPFNFNVPTRASIS